MTQRYYRAHARAYADATATLLPDEALQRFAHALRTGPTPTNALILDAGCGSGRDSAWFLARGHRVDAFDLCPELAAEAQRRFGVPARVASMLDLSLIAAVDAVWASASLVHMPPQHAHEALGRLARAVRPGGLLYASVKEGDGSGTDRLGRTFYYWQAETFTRAVLDAAPHVTLVDQWSNRPTLDVNGPAFLNVLARVG